MNTAAPDYEGLLKLLPRLRRFPDATGETAITPAEAVEIQELGFPAEAGKWNIPFIPFEFVRDSPFEWASRQPQTVPIDGQGKDLRSAIPQGGTNGRQDVEQRRQVSGTEGRCWLEQRMIRAIEKAGGRMLKRCLQKKFWRTRADEFRRALSAAVQAGFLRIEGQSVVLLGAVTASQLQDVPHSVARTHRLCSTIDKRTHK